MHSKEDGPTIFRTLVASQKGKGRDCFSHFAPGLIYTFSVALWATPFLCYYLGPPTTQGYLPRILAHSIVTGSLKPLLRSWEWGEDTPSYSRGLPLHLVLFEGRSCHFSVCVPSRSVRAHHILTSIATHDFDTAYPGIACTQTLVSFLEPEQIQLPLQAGRRSFTGTATNYPAADCRATSVNSI